MTLFLVNRYFHPDHSATGQMLSDLAFHAAAGGARVVVVTGRQRIDHADARLPSHERLRGVDVRRVWSTRFGRARLLGRALDYASFHVGVASTLARVLGRGDTVVAATDPPLLSVTVGWAARLRGAAQVNWLHDLFPEVAEALGVRLAGGPFGRALRALRDASLRRARANVVLGERMRDTVERRGIARARVHVIHNWSDGAAIRPAPDAGTALRERWDLDGRFVVGYSGNLGRAHAFAAMLDAAERLRTLDDVVFLFVGAGARADWVRGQARLRGLGNVRMLPPQPRSRLAQSLAAIDVHLTSLRPELEGLIVPSKIYGVLAAGRPCVHVGDSRGEVARILEEGGCGVTVEVDDGEGLARWLRRWRDDPGERARMGERARALFERRFDMSVAMARWMQVLAP